MIVERVKAETWEGEVVKHFTLNWGDLEVTTDANHEKARGKLTLRIDNEEVWATDEADFDGLIEMLQEAKRRWAALRAEAAKE